MLRCFRLFAFAVLATVLTSFIVSRAVHAEPATIGPVAQASGSGVSEKEAFDAAKELGTIEAWEAFLSNFPKGFRADLARAYVRRLGNEQKDGDKESTPTPTTTPAPAPASPPPQQTATPPPPPPPPAPLAPVDMGPGVSPWRIGTYTFDGGASTSAAIVDARGVQMTAYCTAQRTIPLLISDLRNGIYPDFDTRVQQGINNSGGNGTITFQSGQQIPVRASVQGLTGELVIGDTDAGFSVASPVLEQIMSGNSMTVSLSPFGGTFQLSGSRNAMCSLLRSCGAANSQPGCAAPPPPSPPVITRPAPRPTTRPRPRPVKCTRGRVFSPNRGKCVCPSNAPFWFGGACRHSRECPGDSVLNSRGICVKENEPPPNVQRPQNNPSSQQNDASCNLLRALCINFKSKAACQQVQNNC